MKYKRTAQQGAGVAPCFHSDFAPVEPNGRITYENFEKFDRPLDRRRLPNDASSDRSRFFHIHLGELDFIRRAIAPRTRDADEDDPNNLLTALYEAQEESARRVAQRLHDDASQMLAVVYLELAKIKQQCVGELAAKVEGVEALLDDVCEQIHGLSHELHPPALSHLGLSAALDFLAEGLSLRSALTVSIVGDLERLDSTLEIALYRVVQEALSNVVRHANATQAEVRLWTEPERVCCSITDNGAGFQVPGETTHTTHGLGLLGIYERVTALGGRCDIISCRRKGTHFTEIQVELPL
ncbi:signal transduction histidine kinase [Litorivivens lipolytica]|uniref:Signal transduction histidine kinase n=1 Tax=Litorivivens lipolytica TaxID=1524264 RepID=A0A7W4W5I9_9GAMM|nr:sensor histidine kinase [Litorivivens lipolytica]MBB3047842.1 signal transduction histidine kinase [Litorivivens lipolytica]